MTSSRGAIATVLAASITPLALYNTMDTLLIAEDQIRPFKFWHNQQIATGMSFRNELFAQLFSTSLKSRQQFFQRLDQEYATTTGLLLTVSKQQYTAWVNLRSPLAQSLYGVPEPELELEPKPELELLPTVNRQPDRLQPLHLQVA
ncbi:hypothetical protein [Nodosilinea sp. E11]|uniref:hypothetical protein n=1 Tax=Nodosilinea sp. E11 TaxID=3037479 RepID=UPI0029342CD9|nr:hypothetical protein [Nodosilinea sp. E11]WOD40282.1 hypothetical protein RRF56_05690 [Nodosilinea sp. E11]